MQSLEDLFIVSNPNCLNKTFIKHSKVRKRLTYNFKIANHHTFYQIVMAIWHWPLMSNDILH